MPGQHNICLVKPDDISENEIIDIGEAEIEKIFNLYYRDLYGYGLKLCGKPELVKDAIQELFVAIWEKRENLNQVRSVKAYLLVSLRRSLLKVLKKRRHVSFVTDMDESQPDIYFNIEEIIISREIDDELKEKLHHAINSLSDREKEAIYLKYYNGMSYEEIEYILSVNYQTARNYIYRALKKLKKLLNESEFNMLIILLMRVALSKGI